MQTEAVFDNIAERIQQEISKAQKSIFIAVAWFTNKNLFNELVYKAKKGCTVTLIISNDDINLNSQIDFEQLLINKSKVYKIGNGDTELMHNKFCVIDYSTVITGSYNWSYKAESNFENVIITSNDTTLAEQFIAEFNNIRKKYYPDANKDEIVFPLNKIIKRLEILKNHILLEDIEELDKETDKLKEYDFNADLHEIIVDVTKEEFASAIAKIQNFISKNQQLLIWTDPEIAALKLEIKNLENQLNAFDNEKTELEKIISEFQHRHTLELGEIILEILRLRKLKFKSDKSKYEEAENDERQYREQVDTEKGKEIFKLTDEQKFELKKKFRKASVLCHTDKFANEPIEIQKKAEEIFKELNEANAKNDLNKVSEILANLEKGILSTSKGDKLTDKDKLRATLIRLRAKVKILEAEIIAIKESETFKTIISIENWDIYFEETKQKLINELEYLQNQIIENE
ncbi:MAG: phospholipase D-like domain-containing protein [Bacteroidia bacterium]|nr:phospholipase D-like domain-containing protein [Bacteroidia bacterium]